MHPNGCVRNITQAPAKRPSFGLAAYLQAVSCALWLSGIIFLAAVIVPAVQQMDHVLTVQNKILKVQGQILVKQKESNVLLEKQNKILGAE